MNKVMREIPRFVFALFDTFFSCSEQLFLCLTLISGGYHSLNFDIFRDTPPPRLLFYRGLHRIRELTSVH